MVSAIIDCGCIVLQTKQCKCSEYIVLAVVFLGLSKQSSASVVSIEHKYNVAVVFLAPSIQPPTYLVVLATLMGVMSVIV